MNLKNILYRRLKPLIIFLLVTTISLSFAFKEGDGPSRIKKGNSLEGDSYYLFINNLEMPINRTGVLGEVLVGSNTSGGKIDGIDFLFSGGFFLSGVANGTMFANAVASASRIEDYVAGTVETGPNDPRAQIYVLSVRDGDFSESWSDWTDAVALGAYYYDGDANGVYDPVDVNGNGKWDPETFPGAGDGEDRPDLIGDETVWCVYNDGLDPSLRRFTDVDPKGIEIRQTVFAFASKGITGNMIFVRYSILNTGTVADVIDDVYFGVWADPDLGGEVGFSDDRVGCDTTLNAGFTYNDADDPVFGVNPPAYLIDFFQGPISYVPGETFEDANGNGVYDEGEVALDTAYNVQGQVRGRDVLPGAKNVGISSFMQYIQSHPTQGDPNTRFEARNYMLGTDKFGSIIDPCTWEFGTVLGGVPCSEVNPRFMYSGDPVTSVGWINNAPDDQRQMSNTGPFKLVAGQPVDIVAAYVVARGTNALNSITLTKDYDLTAQLVFDNNFPSPPPPPPFDYEVRTGEGFIDLTWETGDHFNYHAVDTVLNINRWIQGYYVTAYRTSSTQTTINGVVNSEVIARYDLADSIDGIYQIASNGGQNLIIPESENKLDSMIYTDPESGRIRLRMTEDPVVDGQRLIKGHEYYFRLTGYYINHNEIVRRESGVYDGLRGDYYDPSGNAIFETESPLITVTYGEDIYSPALEGNIGTVVSGTSDGVVKYLVVNPEQLTGHEYSVEFFKDEDQPINETYLPYWKLTNNNTNEVLIDSSKIYNFDTTSFAGRVTEGFLTKIKPLIPAYSTTYPYTPAENIWYQSFSDPSIRASQGRGVFYVGRDIPQSTSISTFGGGNTRSNVITADKLRNVEIRFGQTSKAYRYLNGFIGTLLTRGNSYRYAGGVTSADTVGKGAVGNWNAAEDHANGFVDVPFSAFAIEKDGTERQLALGFIERSNGGGQFNGRPDGNWDPDTAVLRTKEVLVIFDSDYSSTPKLEYTGGVISTSSGDTTVWADILKIQSSQMPADAQGVTEEQRAIFNSPWFNAMYVVGLQKNPANPNDFYEPGDVFEIPMAVYPYTNDDEFTFSTRPNGELSENEQKALFDKVNVFPNPLFGYNPATSYDRTGAQTPPDEPFVTFSNLPDIVTVKIYTLSGILIKTLTEADKSSITSPFLRWDLENEDGLRAASGMYLAIVTAQGYGEKLLKFAIILPQKTIRNY